MKSKKLILALIFILIMPIYSYAADSMVVTRGYDPVANIKVIKIVWVDTPSLTLESQKSGTDNFLAGWYCYFAETIPGSGGAAPQDQYDIVITNTAGTDIFGTALTNRSSTSKETAIPTVAGSLKGPFPIKPTQLESDALTFTLTNQNNASGSGTVYLYFARY